MRFLIYGHCNPASGGSCYGNALTRLGHQVVALSDREGLEKYRSGLVWRGYRRITNRLWGPDRRRHVGTLVRLADEFRPDVVMVLKGLHLGPGDVSRLRVGGAWVVNINHDDFFSQYRSSWSPIQRAAIPAYDYILTTREVNVEELQPSNPNIAFFQFAYDPAIHRPVPIPPDEINRWGVDVVFVGHRAPHRAWMMEELVRAVPARYAVYGADWHRLPRRSPLRPYVHFRNIFLNDYAKAIGGASVALGFLRKENRDDYTQRTFEIPACGGVFLAERTARHQAFYAEGEEAEFFDPNTPHELIRKVRRLLTDHARREQIRQAGMAALMRQRHTYEDRMTWLIDLYSRCRRSRHEGALDCPIVQ